MLNLKRCNIISLSHSMLSNFFIFYVWGWGNNQHFMSDVVNTNREPNRDGLTLLYLTHCTRWGYCACVLHRQASHIEMGALKDVITCLITWLNMEHLVLVLNDWVIWSNPRRRCLSVMKNLRQPPQLRTIWVSYESRSFHTPKINDGNI